MRTWPAIVGFIAITVVAATAEGRGAQSTGDAPSLRAASIVVRSIDPRDVDYSDLQALKPLIGNARVVVLGEATHSEGTTTSAKARMVRFLHEEMGFDVLAWESGVVQCWAMNAALRNPEVPLAQARRWLMSGGWSTEEPVQPMLEYIRSTWTTDRPLEMAGFDSDRPRMGAPSFVAFLRSAAARCPSLQLTEQEWADVEALAGRAFGFLSSERPAEADRARQREVLERLARQALNDDAGAGLSPRERTLAAGFIEHALACDEQRVAPPDQWAMTRDRAMAHRFLWLLNEVYPDRKVIVWAATSHLMRHSDQIENEEHPDWYVEPWEMGNHVAPALGAGLYTIAFTSYGGVQGEVFPPERNIEPQVQAVTPAPAGSYEAIAHDVAQPYLFTDLRSAPEDHWLRGRFTSIALGRNVNVAPWSDVVDAFFFIDQSDACRHAP